MLHSKNDSMCNLNRQTNTPTKQSKRAIQEAYINIQSRVNNGDYETTDSITSRQNKIKTHTYTHTACLIEGCTKHAVDAQLCTLAIICLRIHSIPIPTHKFTRTAAFYLLFVSNLCHYCVISVRPKQDKDIIVLCIKVIPKFSGLPNKTKRIDWNL